MSSTDFVDIVDVPFFFFFLNFFFAAATVADRSFSRVEKTDVLAGS